MIRYIRRAALFILLILSLCPAALAAPKECPPDLAAVLGFYQGEGENVIIRERGGRLELLYGVTAEDYAFDQSNVFPLAKSRYDEYNLNAGNPRDNYVLTIRFERDKSGAGMTLAVDRKRFTRRFFPGEREAFTITPVKSIEELRAAAKNAVMPRQKDGLLSAELVDVTKVEPGIKVNMVYAGKGNIFAAPLYEEARALLDKNAAQALQRAHRQLAAFGYGLMVWDAYRPWYSSKTVYDALPDRDKRLVEDPAKEGSPHNKGLSVDVTLYRLSDGQEVKMISGFDELSLRSLRDYQGGSELARWQRDLVRLVMESEGFSGVKHEWWHYEYKGADKYRLLNIGFGEVK